MLPCFSFYKNLDALDSTDLQFKRNFKWKIVHPYKWTNPATPIDKIPTCEVLLKLCTLYKGVPYGPASISFNHPD